VHPNATDDARAAQLLVPDFDTALEGQWPVYGDIERNFVTRAGWDADADQDQDDEFSLQEIGQLRACLDGATSFRSSVGSASRHVTTGTTSGGIGGAPRQVLVFCFAGTDMWGGGVHACQRALRGGDSDSTSSPLIIGSNNFHVSHYRPAVDISMPSMPLVDAAAAGVVDEDEDEDEDEDSAGTGTGTGTHCGGERDYRVVFQGAASSQVRRDIAEHYGARDEQEAERGGHDRPSSPATPALAPAHASPHMQAPAHQAASRGRLAGQAHVKITGRSASYGLPPAATRPFAALLARAVFALCPRGEFLFSYRVFEALAAGAIPVVLADGWVLPFQEADGVDWVRFAVSVPEAQARNLTALLGPGLYPAAKVRALRREGRRVYRRHFRTFEAQARTVVSIVARRSAAAAAAAVEHG
jgi:hypothetical protein